MTEAFFGLKAEPFPKKVRAEDLFLSDGFKELSSRLEYMKKQRGLMFITGEPGTGKTVSIRAFLERLNPSLYLPVYTPLSTVSVRGFYRQLNFKLTGESLHDKVDLFYSIQKAVKDYVSGQKKVPVVVLDEAHLLRPETFLEIPILLNFDIDSVDPLLFIMLGQPYLRDKISLPVHACLNQRFSLKYHIPFLERGETAGYIKHHLKLCGGSADIFSEAAVGAVFQNTAGVPRLINELARKAMTLAAQKRREIITEEEIFTAAKES